MRNARYLVLVAVLVAAGVGGYFIGARPRGGSTPAVVAPKEQPATRDLALEGVPRDGLFVATVKVSKVWDHTAIKPLRDWLGEKPERSQVVEPYLGFSPGELDRVSLFEEYSSSRGLRAIAPHVLLSTKTPYDKPTVQKRLQARTEGWPSLGRLTAVDSTCALLVSPKEGYTQAIPLSVSRFMTAPPDGGIAPAIDEAKNHAITIGLDIDRFSRMVFFKPPPEEGPGAWGMVAPIIDRVEYAELLAARSAILTADFEDALAVRLVLHFADEPAASRAKPALEKQLIALAAAMDREREHAASGGEDGAAEAALLSWAAGALRQVKVSAAGNTLTAEARILFDDGFRNAVGAIPGVLQGELSRKPAIHNLKLIGVGMHSLHDTHGYFPAEKLAMRPPWSWRVQILPHIEHEPLYKLLDMNKPWNDPVNLKALKEAEMPKVFEHPGRPAPKGHTYFRILTLPKGAQGPSPVFIEGSGRRLTDVVDGTSNTILVVEAEESVPWYELDMLPYDGKRPLPALGGKTSRRFLALMADGSIQTLSKNIPEKTLRALITATGGEEIDRGSLR